MPVFLGMVGRKREQMTYMAWRNLLKIHIHGAQRVSLCTAGGTQSKIFSVVPR